MRRLALGVAIGLAAACVPAPSVTVTSPSSLSSFHATPRPSPPTPSPTESPGPLNVASAIGTVPTSFHYFSTGQGESFRILLFDEERAQPPVVVLTSGRQPVAAAPDVVSEAFTVSADGRVVILMRRLSEQGSAYYLLRPESGEVRPLLSGPGLGPPVVSADGQRIAFPRKSEDPAVNGLWLFAIAASPPAPTRLVSDDPPQRVGSPPEPVAWSPDGKWLAIAVGLGDSGTEIAVVDPSAGETRYGAMTDSFAGGRTRVLGPGFAADWRGGERALLITSSRTMFGGRTRVYVADVTTGATRVLYAPSGLTSSTDPNLDAAIWHPSLDRFAVDEHPRAGGVGVPTAIWVRGVDGSATKVAESPFLSSPWWSGDGTKLFSITGGDDSTGSITNLLGTGGGTIFCRRGGEPGRCT